MTEFKIVAILEDKVLTAWAYCSKDAEAEKATIRTQRRYVMLRRFTWENIEVDRLISAFSFSNYGLIAVQFFNSILSTYYKTLKEHRTVLY